MPTATSWCADFCPTLSASVPTVFKIPAGVWPLAGGRIPRRLEGLPADLGSSRRIAFPAKAWGYANIWQAQQTLNKRPLAHIIALDPVSQPLQEIARDNCRYAPMPRSGEEQRKPRYGHGNANHVNSQVERMTMPG